MLEIVEPGLLATVQDRGRRGYGHLGVPLSGAADPWGLAVANALLGNDADAAGIELTLGGARIRAIDDLTMALGGADLGARTQAGHLAPGRAVRLRAGQEVAFTAATGPGVRAYVAVPGGLDVPIVLGSRSTCLIGRFGGLDGRPLAPGDRLAPLRSGAHAGDLPVWPATPMGPTRHDGDGTAVLRVIVAPDIAAAPPRLGAAAWTVSPLSDRMGLRLDPGAAAPGPGTGGSAISHGVVPGTIQLPPDGRPIVLLPDAQPTGGYPVAAFVITADLAALGQLVPGDRVRFETVDAAGARAELDRQRATWREAVDVLQGDAAWADLWHSAGG